MITLAAIAFALGSHSFGIKFNWKPEPSPPVLSTPHAERTSSLQNRPELVRGFLIRLAVHVLTAHAGSAQSSGTVAGNASASSEELKFPAFYAPILQKSPPASTGKPR